MLEARNITKTYISDGTAATALNNVSVIVERGEFVAIEGRSGSGKSTLLNVLSTLSAPDSGQVFYTRTEGEAGNEAEGKTQDLCAVSDRELDRLRRADFSIIFQFHHLMPYLTALENTLLPFMNSLHPVPRAAFDKAHACLERVGLGGKHDRLPGQLSGGEQQRVAIARALVKDSRILFADEPTGSLDKATGDGVMDLLSELSQGGMTVVMVTHDPEFASRAGRVIHMADGQVLP